MKLFLSYSHLDDPQQALCRQIKDCLTPDFDVWFDKEGLHIGDFWETVIEQEVMQSKAFICFLSNNWIASHNCQQELDLALSEGKRIFPVLIDKIDNSRLHPDLQKIQYISALDRSSDGLFSTNVVVDVIREINSLKPVGLTSFGRGTVASLTVLSTPPGLEWCEIPQGEVTLKYDELNQKTFHVSAFRISKYPITNVQYQTFLLNGYRQRIWWHYSKDAYAWRLENDKPAEIGDEDCPYVNVSWYEAIAFCRWLNRQYQDKFAISLPTEAQWQRAAQGDDNRAYPWGNKFDENRCNTIESAIGKPTFVTRNKDSSSPYGVCDMAGNVWEWCLNDSRTPRYTDTHSSYPRSLRGGSWKNDLEAAKVTSRLVRPPHYCSELIGFRLAYWTP